MKIHLLVLGALFLLIACTQHIPRDTHFFLASYPDLEFRDSTGTSVSGQQYIGWEQLNSLTTYQIRDEKLTLVERKTGNLYTGSVKAFHWFAYNLQADYKDGKIERLRYWHPNGELGMDIDKATEIGKAWTQDGRLAIDWNKDQMIYYNPSTTKLREVRYGDRREYYDHEGKMTYYRVPSDTAIWLYYPDDSPRMVFPYNRQKRVRDGIVKQWHANGQLKAIGRYMNNKEIGTWIGYDSLGVETERQIFEDGELVEKRVATLSK